MDIFWQFLLTILAVMMGDWIYDWLKVNALLLLEKRWKKK